MFQQTTLITLTSPSEGSYQSLRIGAGYHGLAFEPCGRDDHDVSFREIAPRFQMAAITGMAYVCMYANGPLHKRPFTPNTRNSQSGTYSDVINHGISVVVNRRQCWRISNNIRAAYRRWYENYSSSAETIVIPTKSRVQAEM